MRAIDADELKKKAFGKRGGLIQTADIDAMPTIEPKPIKEGLLPDGTLHLFTDTDLSKVDRVWVSQNGTHYGDLYYADGEPKIGRWINNSPVTQKCNQCGFVMPDWDCHRFKYCPNCKARMVQEGEDNGTVV